MKLTYTNEEQFINDIAQFLIEAHLNWSNSVDGMPSKDHDNVKGTAIYAYIDSEMTPEEYCELSDTEQQYWQEKGIAFYKLGAQIADKKWEAVKTLLGI